jgi:tetratricopeptide (TPR) repeat protein
MKNKNRHNNDKPDEMRNMAFDGFEDDLLMNERDRDIFDTIGNYMKGQSDIDDILNDPELQNTRNAVEAMISDYKLNSSRNKDNENFIKDIFAEKSGNQEIEDEIDEINLESKNNDIYRITAEWVDSFNSRKEKGLPADSESEERRNFIASSTKSGEVNEPAVEYIAKKRRGISRRLVIRYISFSAAAVLSAFIIIKSLSPSGDPEKLFNMYYEPMNAVSPVTRGVNNNNAINYNSAIADYKNGDFQGALSGFSEAVTKNPSSISASFFLGLSQIELKNYDQAINLLTSVVNNAGEYGKEAHWYLGMVYLKTGDKEKASECFEYLTKSEGFYSERSAKILRYLK